jgi:hypothetical protein
MQMKLIAKYKTHSIPRSPKSSSPPIGPKISLILISPLLSSLVLVSPLLFSAEFPIFEKEVY